MTERRSLIDAALDVFVYAPIGAAVTVGEWLPKLTEKGRERLGDQAQLARVVGRLAVGEGRRRAIQVGQRLVESGAPGPERSGSAGQLPGADRAGHEGADPEGATEGEAVETEGEAVETEPRLDATGEPAAPPAGPGRAPRPASSADRGQGGPARRPPPSLAIPDYDSLSAPQVVARLAGLGPEELEEVRLHETATRARRSVLARIDQLRRGDQ